jgi:hypothetical protein
VSQLMREVTEALKLPRGGGWSAKALTFLEATCSVFSEELSNVSTDSLPANYCIA